LQGLANPQLAFCYCNGNLMAHCASPEQNSRHLRLPNRSSEETPGSKGPVTASRPRPAKKPKKLKLSRLHKPENPSLEDRQIELRRQFGRMQKFRIRKVGGSC
jgi:hypothetical protein